LARMPLELREKIWMRDPLLKRSAA